MQQHSMLAPSELHEQTPLNERLTADGHINYSTLIMSDSDAPSIKKSRRKKSHRCPPNIRLQRLNIKQRQAARARLLVFDSRRPYHPWKNGGHVVVVAQDEHRQGLLCQACACAFDGRDLGLKLVMLLSWMVILICAVKIFIDDHREHHN